MAYVLVERVFNMIAALRRMIRNSTFLPSAEQMGAEKAYDIWASSYDRQPGNLMLDLDEKVFSGLLKGISLKNKCIADIGCGTGRHWDKLLNAGALSIMGFDVSGGMLGRLKAKYPQAQTHLITDNRFSRIPDAQFDAVISTLTVAHIDHIAEALQAWCRILKPQSDIIITDFHPNALAAGGKRTFGHGHRHIVIENFVHYVYEIAEILQSQGFRVADTRECIVDESVKHYYAAKDALHVYDQFKGSRIIYGIHLKRG